MATGTGKTRTSLKIFDRLLRENSVSSLVVATYGNDLLDQWNNTLLNHFNEETLIYHQYGGTSQMGSFLRRVRDQLEVLVISYDNLHKCIEHDSSDVLSNCLLIADEVHNIGSSTRRDRLKGKLKNFSHKLGLSATPLDPYNEERNEFLLDEVGSIIFEFDIKDAISRRILCEFEYKPLFYSLSEKDKKNQKDAFGKFKAMKEKDPTTPKSRLYIMLSKIRKKSEEKLPVFKKFISENPSILEDAIIFVETMEYGKKVQELIHDSTKQYRTYYGVDDEENLQDFSSGEVSTLVTSRAISEGIDIKSVKNVVFFSSGRSRRTTIQRMGRALRTDPSNPEKVATIVDFVVEEDINANSDSSERVPADKERYEWLKELSGVSHIV
jgi:superfamily II DNA or RNA helicase